MARDAYQWYEGQRQGLGELFLTELDNCLKEIQITPAANGKVNKNYRQGKLLRFPYVIVYEIIRRDYCLIHLSHEKRSTAQIYLK